MSRNIFEEGNESTHPDWILKTSHQSEPKRKEDQCDWHHSDDSNAKHKVVPQGPLVGIHANSFVPHDPCDGDIPDPWGNPVEWNQEWPQQGLFKDISKEVLCAGVSAERKLHWVKFMHKHYIVLWYEKTNMKQDRYTYGIPNKKSKLSKLYLSCWAGST